MFFFKFVQSNDIFPINSAIVIGVTIQSQNNRAIETTSEMICFSYSMNFEFKSQHLPQMLLFLILLFVRWLAVRQKNRGTAFVCCVAEYFVG